MRFVAKLMLVQLLFLAAFTVTGAAASALQAQSIAQQIEEAILPLPEHMKAAATVVAVAPDGSRTVLREGTGSFICMRDTSVDHFRVNCLDQIVVPTFAVYARFIGEGRSVVDATRRFIAAMRAGEAPTPPAGAMAYVVAGPSPNNYEHISAMRLPNATAETTGLPLSFRDGGGWLMCQGTPMAHIMFGPEPFGTPEGVVEACQE